MTCFSGSNGSSLLAPRGLLAAAFLPACGSGAATPDEAGGVESGATVAPATAKRAYAIVRGIDYLPFAYKDDGCFARALHISMELAAQKIPSSAEFIAGDLRPPNAMWRFHVAPMLQVSGENHQTIIDPSLGKAPLPAADWIKLTSPRGEYNTFWVPGSKCVTLVDLKSSETYQNVLITSFAELPPFKKSNVQDACQSMWNALSWETPEHEELRPKLIARTAQLLTSLEKVAKLTDDMKEAGAFDCAVPRDQ